MTRFTCITVRAGATASPGCSSPATTPPSRPPPARTGGAGLADHPDAVLLWSKTSKGRAGRTPTGSRHSTGYAAARPVDAVILTTDSAADLQAQRAAAPIPMACAWRASPSAALVRPGLPAGRGGGENGGPRPRAGHRGANCRAQADADAIDGALRTLRDQLAQRVVAQLMEGNRDRYMGELSQRLDTRGKALADWIAGLGGRQRRRIPVASIVFAPYPRPVAGDASVQSSIDLRSALPGRSRTPPAGTARWLAPGHGVRHRGPDGHRPVERRHAGVRRAQRARRKRCATSDSGCPGGPQPGCAPARAPCRCSIRSSATSTAPGITRRCCPAWPESRSGGPRRAAVKPYAQASRELLVTPAQRGSGGVAGGSRAAADHGAGCGNQPGGAERPPGAQDLFDAG
ncbi:hypothetical protein ACU4GD_11745 [Cupriavidus basilensis]